MILSRSQNARICTLTPKNSPPRRRAHYRVEAGSLATHTEITGEMASELLDTIGGGIVGFKRDPHRG
jgi:hypothetical protein